MVLAAFSRRSPGNLKTTDPAGKIQGRSEQHGERSGMRNVYGFPPGDTFGERKGSALFLFGRMQKQIPGQTHKGKGRSPHFAGNVRIKSSEATDLGACPSSRAISLENPDCHRIMELPGYPAYFFG